MNGLVMRKLNMELSFILILAINRRKMAKFTVERVYDSMDIYIYIVHGYATAVVFVDS